MINRRWMSAAMAAAGWLAGCSSESPPPVTMDAPPADAPLADGPADGPAADGPTWRTESIACPGTPFTFFPGDEPTLFEIPVTPSFTAQQARIELSISHTLPQDLRATLEAPRDASAMVFDGADRDPSGSYAFPVEYTGSATAGTWTLSLFNEDSGDTTGTLQSCTLHLTDEPSPMSFTVELSPSARTVAPGQLATYTVTSQALGVFAGRKVYLSITNPRQGGGGLQVGELTAPGSTTIEVPSDFLEPGTYPFTVFGRANRYAGMVRAAPASLTVAAP